MDIKTNKISRKTSDLHIPLKKDGCVDKRYTLPQFCKSDGSRDKRTTNTHKRN
jgi:hypothetical protein